MPVVSKKQFKLMQAVRSNPEVAKRTGIKKQVAEEFLKATPKGAFKKLKEKVGKKK